MVKIRPVLQAVGLVGSDMSNNPDALLMIFGILEFADQPMDLVVGIGVAEVTVKVKVVLVAKVGVERDETESAVGGGTVGAVVVADGG